MTALVLYGFWAIRSQEAYSRRQLSCLSWVSVAAFCLRCPSKKRLAFKASKKVVTLQHCSTTSSKDWHLNFVMSTTFSKDWHLNFVMSVYYILISRLHYCPLKGDGKGSKGSKGNMAGYWNWGAAPSGYRRVA